MSTVRYINVPELASVPNLKWSIADESANEITKTFILKGKTPKGGLINNEILDSLREGRIGEYGYYAGHVVRYGYGREFDEIDITCTDLNVNINASGYYSKFEASAQTQGRALEEKITQVATTGDVDEVYKLWWNHRLIGKIKGGVEPADPSTADVTTLKAMTKLSQNLDGTSLSVDTYAWRKTNQGINGLEKTVLEARYPGVQSYGVGSLQVKEIVYSRSLGVVKNIVKAVGTLKAPRDSANEWYDDEKIDSLKWLVTSATYSKKVGWYEANLTYAYAKGGWLQQSPETGFTGVYPLYTSL